LNLYNILFDYLIFYKVVFYSVKMAGGWAMLYFPVNFTSKIFLMQFIIIKIDKKNLIQHVLPTLNLDPQLSSI